MDDRKGVTAAQRKGLRVTGTLGVSRSGGAARLGGFRASGGAASADQLQNPSRTTGHAVGSAQVEEGSLSFDLACQWSASDPELPAWGSLDTSRCGKSSRFVTVPFSMSIMSRRT